MMLVVENTKITKLSYVLMRHVPRFTFPWISLCQVFEAGKRFPDEFINLISYHLDIILFMPAASSKLICLRYSVLKI